MDPFRGFLTSNAHARTYGIMQSFVRANTINSISTDPFRGIQFLTTKVDDYKIGHCWLGRAVNWGVRTTAMNRVARDGCRI